MARVKRFLLRASKVKGASHLRGSGQAEGGRYNSTILVLSLGITVTYLEGGQAAEANRLFSIFAKRVVRSLRVKVH
jgi:hypothetical protein